MPHQITQPHIYLDHAAGTPLSETARAAMTASFDTAYGNPSSLHQVGRHAHDRLFASKEMMAATLRVAATELIMTGSGTESDNLAILGLARAHRAHGNHIIISAIEHKAVLAAAVQLEAEGFAVTRLPVDAEGVVSLSALQAALRPETILVSVMYANNEIGTVQPVTEVVHMCRSYHTNSQYPLVHTDACQAVGQLPVLPCELGVDAMTLNSAKSYGPKGVGLLYLRAGVTLVPVIVGGDQEGGLRAGTENIALIAGFAAALRESVTALTAHAAAMRTLQQFFVAELQARIPDIQFNGHPTERLPNNVHVTIPAVEGESLVLMLSEAGIYCSTGSACSARDLEPSHVLVAVGQSEEHIHGSLRFSFGRSTTKEELRYTVATLAAVVERLRTITAATTHAYQQKKQQYATKT